MSDLGEHDMKFTKKSIKIKKKRKPENVLVSDFESLNVLCKVLLVILLHIHRRQAITRKDNTFSTNIICLCLDSPCLGLHANFIASFRVSAEEDFSGYRNPMPPLLGHVSIHLCLGNTG